MKPYYEDEQTTIYNGDCREILPHLGQFDLLLTDPPYGLGSRLDGKSGEWSKHFSEAPAWDVEPVEDEAIYAAINKTKDSVIWGGNYYALKPARCWFAWDKMQQHTSGHFELAWTTFDLPTRMFKQSRVEAYGRMDKVHPTQKPVGLMQWCLSFAPDASTVLDPFMGSGTTLLAAKLEGRRAIGIEKNREYCDIAVERLRQRVLF